MYWLGYWTGLLVYTATELRKNKIISAVLQKSGYQASLSIPSPMVTTKWKIHETAKHMLQA